MPHTKGSRTARLALAAGTVVAVDQGSKVAAPLFSHALPGLVLPLRNPALSLGTAHWDRWLEVALMAAGIAVLAVVARRLLHAGRLPGWAAGLALGGSVSNLLDRVALGDVRDFLVVGPVVVNVADVAVLLGLLLVTVALCRPSLVSGR